jgi:ceramide glucosyltransferase
MLSFHPLLSIIGFACLSVAAVYSVLTVTAMLVWRLPRSPQIPESRPPVTLLKPLCGAEPGLYEDLRSFCLQDYPEFQIVFGVRDPADPARAVAERLRKEFPTLPIKVVVNPRLHGSNCKISNLINMLAHARHDVLILADSDAIVDPHYLNTVTAPLLDPGVGLVTCIYRDIPTSPVWSRLGAMYINEWYVPSVLFAWLFGHQNYVSGQTICLRRDTLQAIGGLEPLANTLADDYQLGERVRGLGLRIELSPYVVTGEHHEPSYDSVTRHELRWMRTIRVLRPMSFRFMFVTFSLPMAVVGLGLRAADASLGAVASLGGAPAIALFATTLASRLALHFLPRIAGPRPLLADFLLLPLRDLLVVWVWLRSFFTSRVTWRGNVFDVDAEGVMRRLT